MATRLQDKKADLLERVVDRLHDQLAEGHAERAEAFLRHYYRAVSAIDLLERDLLDLYGAALSHLRLANQRTAGEATVRVYNPQIEQHGWQSTHTVVEVVTDDMPFLVNSMSMALNRLGLLIHITIHPVMPVKRDADGTLDGGAGIRGGGRRRGPLRILHAFRDRPADRSRAHRGDPRRSRAGSGRRPGRGRGLADHARQGRRPRSPTCGAGPRRSSRPSWRRPWPSCAGSPTTISRSWLRLLRSDARRVGRSAAAGRRLGARPAAPAGLEHQISRSFATLPPELRRQAREPAPLTITKANARSTVHRPVYLDYIGVRRFDAKGKVERRAPLPRPVHLGRLQSQSARHPAAAPQGVADDRARPAVRRRAIPARRSPTSWRPIRATSCSRPRTTSCSRPCRRSCTCMSGR